MAIKLPDPGNGIPEQKTGNDEWTNMKIVRDNFADQSNAASRLVGVGNGQIPLAQQTFEAAHNSHGNSHNRSENGVDLNTLPVGYSAYIGTQYCANAPSSAASYGLYQSRQIANGNQYQVFYAYDTGEMVYRAGTASNLSDWRPSSQHSLNYRSTTASNPNVFVDSNGKLSRSTSSMKYKDLIGRLELDEDSYKKAMAVSPIVYRSKADADPKNWHFLSFSAEELGEYDPALTQWKTHETITDEATGEVKTVELKEKEAEGINLHAICAVLHATNIYQDKKIKELEQRLTALEQTDEPAI